MASKKKQASRYLSKYTSPLAYLLLLISSLKTCPTKNSCFYNLAKFLNSEANKDLSLEEVLSKSTKIPESEIIQIIIKLKEEEGPSSSSKRLFLASVMHFFSINDVPLNRKKIKKFLGEHENE